MIIDTSQLNVYWLIIVNAICTGVGMGVGMGIGSYISNHGIIKGFRRLKKRMLKKRRKT
jgi:hypothetical protein